MVREGGWKQRIRCMFVVVTCNLAVLPLSTARAQAPGADRWQALVVSNNLDAEGSAPFHIQISFELFDMAGVSKESGTVDEWWADAHHHRVVMSSPMLDAARTSAMTSPEVMRERYLVHRLLELAVRPVPNAKKDVVNKEVSRDFGQVTLTCLESEDPKNLNIADPCFIPGSDAVRLVRMPSDVGNLGDLTRNAISKFQNTDVASSLAIELLGHNAVRGKITVLESVSPEELSHLAQRSSTPDAEVVPGNTLAANMVKRGQPVYPIAAKLARMDGSVILCGTIGKDGAVLKLAPVASTNALFTEVAMDAVKKWKYQPYLMQGQPMEVDTTVTVNFRMNPPPTGTPVNGTSREGGAL